MDPNEDILRHFDMVCLHVEAYERYDAMNLIGNPGWEWL